MDRETQALYDKNIEYMNQFEYLDPETKYLYKRHGNVVHRYSVYLTKWILELDGRELNFDTLKSKSQLSNAEKEGFFIEIIKLYKRNKPKSLLV